MIRFEVTGNDANEFRTEFSRVLGVFLPLLKPAEAPPTQPVQIPPAENADAPKTGEVISPKERKKREPKAETEKPSEPVQIDLEEKIAEAKLPSIEDLRGKLRELGKAKDHDTVFKLLDSFGVKNASSVPAEKRAEVIAAIDAKLAE